jgi:soluble cytochrome b562
LVYQGAINSTSEILGYSETKEFKEWKKTASKKEVKDFEEGFGLLMTKFNPGNRDIEELAKDLIEISNLARENRLFVNIKL